MTTILSNIRYNNGAFVILLLDNIVCNFSGKKIPNSKLLSVEGPESKIFTSDVRKRSSPPDHWHKIYWNLSLFCMIRLGGEQHELLCFSVHHHQNKLIQYAQLTRLLCTEPSGSRYFSSPFGTIGMSKTWPNEWLRWSNCLNAFKWQICSLPRASSKLGPRATLVNNL